MGRRNILRIHRSLWWLWLLCRLGEDHTMTDSKTDAGGATMRMRAVQHAQKWGISGVFGDLIAAFAEAEIARAAPARCDAVTMEALEECLSVLELVEQPRCVDPDYGAEVEALGERIGFGALMSSASASWRKFLAREGMPLGSEFVAGPCHATVLLALKKVRAALSVMAAERCAKCGCETRGETALVNGEIWCHPCADVARKLSRDEIRNDPTVSSPVKGAMEHFWKLSDQYEAEGKTP